MAHCNAFNQGIPHRKSSILEHDADFPDDITVLLDEVKRAKTILAASRGRVDGAVTTTGESVG